MFETYKPSGGFGAMLIPALLVGMVIVAGLSWIYQLLLEWIPFIYISFLLTIGAGLALSVIGATICSFGHCRNWFLGLTVGVLLTLAFVGGKFWFQYQTSVPLQHDFVVENIANNENFDGTLEDARQLADQFIAEEYTLLDHLQARVDQGWQIGRGGGGAPISGVFVYLIWLLEIGIVGFIALTGSLSQASQPYSEKLSQWASEEEHIMSLPISNDEMVVQINQATTVDELLQIPIPKSDQSNAFAVYKTNSIPGQELEDAYLTVQLVQHSVNSKGEEEKTETPLVTHAILTAEKRKELIENASLLKEALADYRHSLDNEPDESESEDEGEEA